MTENKSLNPFEEGQADQVSSVDTTAVNRQTVSTRQEHNSAKVDSEVGDHAHVVSRNCRIVSVSLPNQCFCCRILVLAVRRDLQRSP